MGHVLQQQLHDLSLPQSGRNVEGGLVLLQQNRGGKASRSTEDGPSKGSSRVIRNKR